MKDALIGGRSKQAQQLSHRLSSRPVQQTLKEASAPVAASDETLLAGNRFWLLLCARRLSLRADCRGRVGASGVNHRGECTAPRSLSAEGCSRAAAGVSAPQDESDDTGPSATAESAALLRFLTGSTTQEQLTARRGVGQSPGQRTPP